MNYILLFLLFSYTLCNLNVLIMEDPTKDIYELNRYHFNKYGHHIRIYNTNNIINLDIGTLSEYQDISLICYNTTEFRILELVKNYDTKNIKCDNIKNLFKENNIKYNTIETKKPSIINLLIFCSISLIIFKVTHNLIHNLKFEILLFVLVLFVLLYFDIISYKWIIDILQSYFINTCHYHNYYYDNDNIIFTGYVCNNMPHGEGSIYLKNKTLLWKGDFLNGLPIFC